MSLHRYSATHTTQRVWQVDKDVSDCPKASSKAQTFQVSQRGCRRDRRTEPYKRQTDPTSS